MKRPLPFVSLAFMCFTRLAAQDVQAPLIDSYYTMLRNSFKSDRAYQTVAFVEQRWRIAGNSGFNESIGQVEEILRQAGYKKEERGENEGPLTYRIEKRKMNRPTWEPASAT